MQAFEGEEEKVVRRLHDKIQADRRHKNIITLLIITLLREPLEAQRFGDWSIAFHNVNLTPGISVLLPCQFLSAKTIRQSQRNRLSKSPLKKDCWKYIT